MIRDRAFVDDLALRVEHTDRVLVAEIKTDGDSRNGVFDGRRIIPRRSSAARCLLI